MSKAERKAAKLAERMLQAGQVVDGATQDAPDVEGDLEVKVEAKPEAPKATTTPTVYVLGAKAPKHRVGHTGAAWAAMLPLLPTTADKLAALPELKVPQCGGPKGNGMLYVGYAIRRGWLAKQA